MKRKLVTYFPIAVLAVGLTLGMAAAFMALRPSGSVPTVSAQTTPGVIASPATAGELVEYTITVTGSTTTTMVAGAGELRVTFDKDAQIPASIPASAVLIKTSHVSGASSGVGCTTGDSSTTGAGQAVALSQAPSQDVDTADPNRKILILKVPDMNPASGTDTCGNGSQGIGTSATINIIFTTAAGIKNPSELETSTFNIAACATACGTNLLSAPGNAPTVFIASKITISAVDGARGTVITVVAKGFNNGTTATFWLDNPGGTPNNTRDPGESDLATVVVGSDDIATATFTVTNPPFKPGKVNAIAVVDGENRRLNVNNNATSAESLAALPRFELRGSVEATPTTVRLGDTITIQLKDFDGGGSCDLKLTAICPQGTGPSPYGAAPNIQLGGKELVKANFTGTTLLNSNGEATFTAIVPNGVAIGSQALEVRNACCVFGGGAPETRRQTLVVGGAVLVLTPGTVVPNQTLSITGNDFTTSDVATGVTINEAVPFASPCVQQSAITIQGVAIARNKINDNGTINVAAGGNWSASILIPVNVTTTTPGTYDLKVTDCQGREGVGKLTVPPRVINITPKEGQVGTPVTITGTGFPAKNDRSGSVSTTIEIKYDAGAAGGITTISVQPDASGNISGTLTVPTNSNIPSSNNVTTDFPTESPISRVINTVVHEVPRATIAITPATGKPGTKVTASIKGAKAFSTISSALIGASLDVKPAPTPFTDGFGNVTFDFIVPQMEVGVQNLEIKIGNTTASAAFTVEGAATVPPPGSVPPTTPIAAALTTPLGVDFVRAFNFNNQTKVWTFNDPRPEFATINTLKDINGGLVYWINVANDKTITFCGRSVTFYKGWNQSPC